MQLRRALLDFTTCRVLSDLPARARLTNARFCPKDGTTIRPDSVLVDVGDRPASRARSTPHGAAATSPPTQDAATTPPTAEPRRRSADRRGCSTGAIASRRGSARAASARSTRASTSRSSRRSRSRCCTRSSPSTDEFRKRFEREAQAASRLHASRLRVGARLRARRAASSRWRPARSCSACPTW